MSEAEFTQRVLAMEGKLYRVALAMLTSDADRKDATRQALKKAWLCRGQLRDCDQFDRWLIRILVGECKGRRCRRADLQVPGALFALHRRLRLPVMLHYVEGYGVSEIAHMVGARPFLVKIRLRLGQKKLGALLGQGGDGP